MTYTYAEKYHLNKERFHDTVKCESNFDATVQSGYIDADGHQEESYGVAQIHLPDHPDITREEATDPDFSLEYMAKAWSWMTPTQIGNTWHCYRLLFLR